MTHLRETLDLFHAFQRLHTQLEIELPNDTPDSLGRLP